MEKQLKYKVGDRFTDGNSVYEVIAIVDNALAPYVSKKVDKATVTEVTKVTETETVTEVEIKDENKPIARKGRKRKEA